MNVARKDGPNFLIGDLAHEFYRPTPLWMLDTEICLTLETVIVKNLVGKDAQCRRHTLETGTYSLDGDTRSMSPGADWAIGPVRKIGMGGCTGGGGIRKSFPGKSLKIESLAE